VQAPPLPRRLAAASAAVLAIALAGCGASESDKVRSTVEGYAHALGAGNGAEACSKLAGQSQQRVVQALGRQFHSGNCGEVVSSAMKLLSSAQRKLFTDASVGDVRVTGKTATATVRLKGAPISIEASKIGGKWLISSAAGITG
jgi:hypothetical protein